MKSILPNPLVGSWIKDDGSIVTTRDVNVEREIIEVIKATCGGDIQIISEENPGSHREKYNILGDYAIIDPIDGTENYLFGTTIYGSAISLRYMGDEYHMIAVPAHNQIFSNINLDWCPKDNITSNIQMYSTKCLNHTFESTDSARIFGCSTYMFSQLLQKRAKSYEYCSGAKIWDCYTGLKLAQLAGCTIYMKDDLNMWFTQPTHLTEFRIEWL